MNPEVRQTLIDIAITLLLALLPLALYVAKQGVRRLAELAGAKLSEDEFRKLDWALAQSVAYAEEWGRKHLAADGFSTGEAKLETAINTARALAGSAAQQYTDSELTKLLEARVATLRPSMAAPASAAAVGDTGDTWPRLPAVGAPK